jgi:hypothetical protein
LISSYSDPEMLSRRGADAERITDEIARRRGAAPVLAAMYRPKAKGVTPVFEPPLR